MKNGLREKAETGIAFYFGLCSFMVGNWAIHFSSLPILIKNRYTFFCSAPLIPLAYFISKLINVDFQNKQNPLTKLGLMFTVNQMLYLPIVMWVYAVVPDKMVMVYAMVFGAHLFPYGWLYQSKAYCIFSLAITIGGFMLGLYYPAAAIAIFMVITETIFSCCLMLEHVMENSYEKK